MLNYREQSHNAVTRGRKSRNLPKDPSWAGERDDKRTLSQTDTGTGRLARAPRAALGGELRFWGPVSFPLPIPFVQKGWERSIDGWDKGGRQVNSSLNPISFLIRAVGMF